MNTLSTLLKATQQDVIEDLQRTLESLDGLVETHREQ